MGGVAYIFLTHRDDVADAARYAARFGSHRIIHRSELASQPAAEIVIDGNEPVEIAADFQVVPTPGHTRGHSALDYVRRFLFSGDHLSWNRDHKRLGALRDHCWHSWPQQIESMRRLVDQEFEWVLPGHGQRVHLPGSQMKSHLIQLVERMRKQ